MIKLNFSNILTKAGFIQKSLEEITDTLEEGRKLYDEKSPKLLCVFQNYVQTYIKLRDFKSAAEYQDKIVKIYRRLYHGKSHPNLIFAIH